MRRSTATPQVPVPMIAYNPKEWFSILFRFHKADTFRKLFPLIVAIAAYSGLIAWLETSVWSLGRESPVKNLSLIHSTLGLVISLLLVFRTNTAYDRWWEGRKIWGGLVNASRNLAVKLHHLAPDDRGHFAALIPNFAAVLRNHLRGDGIPSDLLSAEGCRGTDLEGVHHGPSFVVGRIAGRLYQLERSGSLRPEHLIPLSQDLNVFLDAAGACERIRKTPIPFSYSVFLKKFIFLYVMTLPFAYVFPLGYWVIPVVSAIFYVLASLELIAEEIEDPFGKDSNDLPLESICETIRESVSEILAQSRADPRRE